MKKFSRFTLAAPLLLSSAQLSLGAGFQLQEHSSAGLGRAFAGEAAIAENASAMATNTASLILLEGTQFSSGFSYVDPSVDFSGRSTPKVGPASATSDRDIGPSAIIPNAYLSHKLSDYLAIGIALNSRFGLSTNYSDSFLGSSFANQSEITTFYISPKVAYKVNDKWSIGAGFDIVYADGLLTNSFPTSTPGLGGRDIARIEGDDWSYGFNLGTFYQVNEKTRLGLSFHSEVDLKIRGDITSQTPGLPATSPAELDTTLPASIEFSAYHEIDSQWAIHSSVTWTGWSTFDQLVVSSNTPGFPPIAQQNWKDAHKVALGTTYKYNEKWTFRAGTAFDESPVRSAEFRSLRIPDSDRFWISAGATYVINEQYSVDFGYSYIFGKTVQVSESNDLGNISGNSSASVNIIGLSFNGKF